MRIWRKIWTKPNLFLTQMKEKQWVCVGVQKSIIETLLVVGMDLHSFYVYMEGRMQY